MTHTPLTKAEREELPARIEAAITTVCSGMAAMSIPANPRDVDLVLADCAKALADLDAAEAERDAHKELIDAARYDVGERSFLEDAQNILKECVAAYSCEQMQAVAKALRQWRDKWAILLETVVRTCEDRDDMMAQRDRAEAERDEWREAAKTHLAGKVDAWSQRDRAESELDAERRMRVEAEAAAKRAESERDALKAKLAAAESAHSELFLSGQVAELRGKLAALVEAAARVRIAEDAYEGSEDQSTDYQEVHRSTTDLWAMLDAAIAAARGGAS